MPGTPSFPEQLLRRYSLLPAYQLPVTRPNTSCQSGGQCSCTASIASPPAPMELYHMVYKFGGDPRNEARVPKFRLPSLPPGFS